MKGGGRKQGQYHSIEIPSVRGINYMLLSYGLGQGVIFELRAKGEVEADLRRVLEAYGGGRGIIKAEVRSGEKMSEESLEGKTRRKEEAKARLGVATEALDRAD